MAVPVPLLPRWLRWLAVAAVAAAIFYLSVLVVPPAEEPITTATRPALVPLDKWRHFLGYAVLGWALAYATADLDADPRYLAAGILAATAAYGLAVELAQSTVPRRQFSLLDAYANAVGGAVALAWFAVRPFVRFVPVPRPGRDDAGER